MTKGVIEVYEKVRTEKKATKRLVEIVKEATAIGNYQITVIHGNAPQKSSRFTSTFDRWWSSYRCFNCNLGSVIGTHLGEGSIALAYTPII